MDAAVVAALFATTGFAAGDVFTALYARRVNGRASMFLLTSIKLLLYVPFMLFWRHEYASVDSQSIAWIVLLGALFTIAYIGFNLAFEMGRNPALVGVVAGCFPASASVVAIFFLGQRPSPATLVLLFAVLTGVIMIGLPENWRKSMQIDQGVLLALVPMVFWGIFGALLHEPVVRINTPHGWFVVQSLVAVVMVLLVCLVFNRHIPGFLGETNRKRVWRYAITAGVILGIAEALQALSLGGGKQLVIIEALLGSYPAVYFLIANRVFREPLIKRQWLGIILVIIAITLLSLTAATTA
jgi:drug/metabolite transporter (DMT)-like permease